MNRISLESLYLLYEKELNGLRSVFPLEYLLKISSRVDREKFDFMLRVSHFMTQYIQNSRAIKVFKFF